MPPSARIPVDAVEGLDFRRVRSVSSLALLVVALGIGESFARERRRSGGRSSGARAKRAKELTTTDRRLAFRFHRRHLLFKTERFGGLEVDHQLVDACTGKAALQYGASDSYSAARFIQASGAHFQQCAEFLLLRNRGLGPLAVAVLPIPLARRAATTVCAAV